MSDSSTAREFADLLRETGERHHDAFIDTDGADPEWPLWYADYLFGRIGAFVEAQPTKSKIVQWLVNAADAHAEHGPTEPWPAFYARYILGLGVGCMDSGQSPT